LYCWSVSFASAVQPILTASCALAGCHKGATSQKGLDLYPVLLSLMEWGDRYKVEEPPVRLIHKACGEEAEPHLVCSHCSEPVGYFDLRAEYAPGAW